MNIPNTINIYCLLYRAGDKSTECQSIEDVFCPDLLKVLIEFYVVNTALSRGRVEAIDCGGILKEMVL